MVKDMKEGEEYEAGDNLISIGEYRKKKRLKKKKSI